MKISDRFRKTFALSVHLYRYIWTTSRPLQVAICVLTMILAPLMMVPLELQRRIVNGALVDKDMRLVFISGLNKIADPWDELVNFYRSVSNTAVAYDMIRTQLVDDSGPVDG
jgi:hypothetical protein